VTGIKITKNTKQDHFSKNLTLNVSIIVLVFINIYLGYSITRSITNFYNDDKYDLLNDTTLNRIQIEVLNGCGSTGIAENVTDYLREKGFDVVKLGNYRTFEIESCIIISRNEKVINAEKVAIAVGLTKNSIISQINPEYFLDVTFILGKDYKNLVPLQKRYN